MITLTIKISSDEFITDLITLINKFNTYKEFISIDDCNYIIDEFLKKPIVIIDDHSKNDLLLDLLKKFKESGKNEEEKIKYIKNLKIIIELDSNIKILLFRLLINFFTDETIVDFFNVLQEKFSYKSKNFIKNFKALKKLIIDHPRNSIFEDKKLNSLYLEKPYCDIDDIRLFDSSIEEIKKYSKIIITTYYNRFMDEDNLEIIKYINNIYDTCKKIYIFD